MKTKTIIYADSLIFINVIVTYFLLRGTAAVTGSGFSTPRFLLSSAVGGISSLLIFVNGIHPVVNFIIKLAVSSLIVLAAFGFGSLKAFLKFFAAFFLADFAFAGIMLAGCKFFFGEAVIYKNGAVYFEVGILTLTLAALVCYGILSLISRITRSRTPGNAVYIIETKNGEKSVTCKALLDTGNSLCDSFSGKPVVIMESSIAQRLIPDDAADENGNPDITLLKGFRLIPCTTVSGAGALPAFPVDSVNVTGGGRVFTADKVYIAVTERKIISGGYSALIGIPLIDYSKEERGNKNVSGKNHFKNKRIYSENKVKDIRYRGGLYKRSGYSSASSDGREGSGLPETLRRGG